MDGSERFYITTTIPYVNAAPHLGHALEFVQADIIARYHRGILGEETYFMTGTDENAIKNVQAAQIAGVPVADFVATNSARFKDLLQGLNISNDDFVRTTEPRHIKAAQALWEATRKDIYKKSYTGLYCTGCEMFYKKEELNEKGECFEHPGRPVEEVTEENYFFKLSNYEGWLKRKIESGDLSIIPKKRENEVLAVIKGGLEDFSVSRPAGRSKNWGVLVPGDDSQTLYVWYDALVNYITGLGYPDDKEGKFKKFWTDNPLRMHVLGKGVSRFHAIYWPAMLESAGLLSPSIEFIHGYITVHGEKMSKSAGNGVDPFEVVEKFGTDAFRYWVAREISTFDDGDFTWEKFKESYNANLANGLGNLVSRVVKMGEIVDARLPASMIESRVVPRLGYLDTYEIQKAADAIWKQITEADLYIQQTEPFKKVMTDKEGARRDVVQLLNSLLMIAKQLAPFLPGTSEKILAALKSGKLDTPLFPRVS
jgi:methionyl-tRNA synthetase